MNSESTKSELFTQHLPGTWDDLGVRKDAHYGVLNAIQRSFIDQEATLLDLRAQNYLDSASEVYLDVWGSFIGLVREPNESDETYRTRIKKYMVVERGTVDAIKSAVEEQFDNQVVVRVYEPWRDIFILNKSKLNSGDYLQGNYYRFAVIDIHISRLVDQESLARVIDQYKDAGVRVVTTVDFSLEADVVSSRILSYDTPLVFTGAPIETQGRYFELLASGLNKRKTVPEELFRTNASPLNSDKKLSGSDTQSLDSYNVGFYRELITIPRDNELLDVVGTNPMLSGDDLIHLAGGGSGYLPSSRKTNVTDSEVVEALARQVAIVYSDPVKFVYSSDTGGDLGKLVDALYERLHFSLVKNNLHVSYSLIDDTQTQFEAVVNAFLKNMTFSVKNKQLQVTVSPTMETIDSVLYLAFDVRQYAKRMVPRSLPDKPRYIRVSVDNSPYGMVFSRLNIPGYPNARVVNINGRVAYQEARYGVYEPNIGSGYFIIDIGENASVEFAEIDSSYATPVKVTVETANTVGKFTNVYAQYTQNCGIIWLTDINEMPFTNFVPKSSADVKVYNFFSGEWQTINEPTSLYAYLDDNLRVWVSTSTTLPISQMQLSLYAEETEKTTESKLTVYDNNLND